MQNPLFIGIDIGTQGTKAVLCESDGTIVCESFCPSRVIRDDDGAIYEDPSDILGSVEKTISELVRSSAGAGERVRGICMDCQMAGIMAIDENGDAVTPLDSWLDTRCAPYTELLKKEAGDEAIALSGGQMIHSHASKILWWKNERPDVYERIAKFVEPNAYVAGKLCSLKADDAFMDYTFLHFNIFSDNKNLAYNEKLLEKFGISKDKLPRIVSPENIVGTVTPEWAEKLGLFANVAVLAGCGDTAASSLGAGVVEKGIAYDVAGTASVFACCTDEFSPDAENKTLLFSRSIIDGLYLPLSYITGGGLCLSWFASIAKKGLRELDCEVANSPDIKTPFFIPHFNGRTFPLDNSVSGAFIGLTQDTTKTAMYKSVMESIAYEYDSYFSILKKTGCADENVKVIGVGGGAKSAVFSQIKSDVLGIEYITPKSIDSAPVACAMLACHATRYTTKSLKEIFSPDFTDAKVYKPCKENHESYKSRSQSYLSILNNFPKF